MRIRTYVSVQGKAFNAQEFHKTANKSLSGHVGRRKHTGKPLADVPLEYWSTSEVVVTTSDPEPELAALLGRFVPLLSALPGSKEIEVFAHVVIEFDQGEEPRGFYFSRKTIGLLNAVGAHLDIDAVPRVPRSSGSPSR